MSNAIRYDSLLVHYLARELHERLSGRRLRALRFDPDPRRLILELDETFVAWELHPTRGWITALGRADGGADGAAISRGWGGRPVRIQRRARVRSVSAPPDERFLEVTIDAAGEDRAARVVVELMTNQWNALALSPSGRILSALWTRDAGDRPLRRGETYTPPSQGGQPRAGRDTPLTLDAWRELLAGVPAAQRRRTLVRSVAWMSPINAPLVLGDAGRESPAALEPAWRRYHELATLPDPAPRVLELDRRTPYPLPLPGAEGRAVDSVLMAIGAVAGRAGAGATPAPAATEGSAGGTVPDPPGFAAMAGRMVAPEVREALEGLRERAARRAERLREEADSAPERAALLRRQADLLMSQLHAVRKGQERVELDDFEGGTVSVKLDPSLTPAENGESLYARAKKRERAAERLPARVREAAAERDRLDALLTAIDRGDAEPEELERWLREVRPHDDAAEDEERLPYHRFTSSGGLEIRVGRSGRANDALTFHHSSPDDIWLHARDVAGAHVILRWPDRDQNPPKRDLVEAAVLAAVNSRARTSGTVPVDWTRRKYVRKPRKAPAGAVLPERVSTVFVEPDEGLPGRLGG